MAKPAALSAKGRGSLKSAQKLDRARRRGAFKTKNSLSGFGKRPIGFLEGAREMKNAKKTNEGHIKDIEGFLSTSGLMLAMKSFPGGKIHIRQKKDQKTISFGEEEIESILRRQDMRGEEFLQVNFINGKKILLTKEFIGFSPAICEGLEASQLPKVVTTVDLFSVIEAIEGTLYGKDRYRENIYDVKNFFEAIACGAEAIGFNLTGERLWVEKLVSSRQAVSSCH